MLRYNAMPSATWNWLRMNEGQTDFSPVLGTPLVETEGALQPGDAAPFESIATSAGEDFSAALAAAGILPQAYVLPEGETGFLRLTLPEGGSDRLFVELLPGAKLTLVTIVPPHASAALDIRFIVHENAALHLTQLFGSESRVLSSVGGVCHADASIETVQLSLGGQVGLGAFIDLAGEKSAVQSYLGYLAGQGERLDINWVARQRGRQSQSLLQANGALSGDAAKVFRGTIDFVRGASGSVGAENEDVLLLSPHVHNQTIPIILCAEEDVSGTHGASLGKLAEDALYYMQSRGLSEEAIISMMTRARMAAICQHIRDDQTRQLAAEWLGGEEDA